MTLSTLSPAALLASAIQWEKRGDGSEFLRLADGSPQWMRDAIRSAHDEELPNDWRYELALRAALALRDSPAADRYELAYEVAEELSTVYTAELLHWYTESPARLSYADEAREELGSGSADDVGGMLQLGQWLAAQRGALALFDALSEACI